jgi:hypothetical protein
MAMPVQVRRDMQSDQGANPKWPYKIMRMPAHESIEAKHQNVSAKTKRTESRKCSIAAWPLW